MLKSLYAKTNEWFGRHGIFWAIIMWVVAPGAIATLMTTLAVNLAWFWQTFQWFGVVSVFVLTWMTVGVVVVTSETIVVSHQKRIRRKQSPPLAWKSLLEAIDAFCDPQWVWGRHNDEKHWDGTRDTIASFESEMQQLNDAVPGGGFRDRPDDLKKYNELQQKLQRYSDLAGLTETSLRYDWDSLREDVCERLRSGELIARGFAEPYKGGDNVMAITQSEWHLLDVNPYAGTAVKRNEPSAIVYSGVQIVRAISPILEITFDPSNPGRKFWSLESNKDEAGNPIAGSYWEYRAQVRNKSQKTLRNVKVVVEAVGPMPTRPEPSHFDITKERLTNLNPEEPVLAVLRRWWNPAIVVGMVCGGAYGPIKMTVSADDVRPVSKLFWFDPELTPMITEIKIG